MLKLLHFADAHIDMANFGRHDPQSGLPVRVMDFLKSLDTIIETAISERVDAVLFAGDAFKDRSPAPTFQREWGRRIMRLSREGIPTLLLVGNHDLSPALNRAHALDSFYTLGVPMVRVLDRPAFLGPEDLFGVQMQVIALPWITRSGLIAHMQSSAADLSKVHEEMEKRLGEVVQEWLAGANPDLPVVMMAHASVQGATYGGERTVMLGSDLVLPGSLVKDPRLDYTALGHIHKAQNLNEDNHPPVVYPGSIERVDFGEAQEDKYFVIAHVSRGKSEVEWRKLEHIRPFYSLYARLESAENVTEKLLKKLPNAKKMAGAVVRFVIEYPRDWETLIDEAALHTYAAEAFEFHLIKKPQMDGRVRLPDDKAIDGLSPLELLDLYWRAGHTPADEASALKRLAVEIIQQAGGEEEQLAV